MRKPLLDKNCLYYLAYVIWFSGSMLFGRSTLEIFLGMSSVFWLKRVCYPICAVLLILVFFVSGFFKRPNNKQLEEYVILGILVGLFGISWMVSGWGSFFMELMFIVAAKEIDLRKLPYIVLAVWAVIIPLIICLALTGTIENVSYIYERMNRVPVYRQAWGLRHPNALGAQVVQFCICWLWIRWDKWKWYDYFVYVISICFIYIICNSMTSVFLILLIAVVNFFYRILIKQKHTYVFEKLMSVCIWGVPIACILTGYFYSESSALLAEIDRIVAWRFKIASWFLRDYPLRLFGNRLPGIIVELPEVISSDVVYIDVIVRYGCIVLFLILLGMYGLMKYAVREKLYPLVISIFIYTLYGIMEQCPYQLMYNFTLIYLTNVIYNKNFIHRKGK